MKRIGVILSGCGVFDGAEIHEATLTLLALDQHNAKVTVAAPDISQTRVYDHFKGAEVKGETRNCLVEAARIARGAIIPLSQLDPNQLDGAILPGGFGAALNLSNFASAGANMEIEKSLSEFLSAMIKQGKPLAALCIAPPILAKACRDAGKKGVKITIGNDKQVAKAIEALGQTHVECAPDSCIVDQDAKVVTCPAYMNATGIAQLWKGIEKTVSELLKLIP